MADLLSKAVNTDGLGDYLTFNSCLTANAQDLVSNDKYFEISGAGAAADTTSWSVTGYTTDGTRYIKFTGNNNTAYYNTNFYHSEVTGTNYIYEEFTTIQNVQMKMTTAGNYKDIIYCSVGDGGIIDIINCIFWGAYSGTANNNIGINMAWSDSVNRTLNVINCIFIDIRNSTTNSYHACRWNDNWTGAFYNNTMVNCYYGIYRNGGTVYAKNNLAYLCTDGYNGSWGSGSDYNTTDEAAATGGAHDHVNQTFDFVDADNDKFAITTDDTGAKEQGISLSADAIYDFDYDIVDTTRPSGSLWDCGAFEFVSGGGVVIPVFVSQLKSQKIA